MWSMLLLAIGLSLDGLAVGLSYGLRRIRIPFTSMLVIALCTTFSISTSMIFSQLVAKFITFLPTHLLGGIVLFFLGLIQILKAKKDPIANMDNKANKSVEPKLTSLVKIQIKTLGLVIQILKSPNLADVDQSGIISLRESILLGLALAIDSFAAGIAAGLSGMDLSLILIVALTQMLMIGLGRSLTGMFTNDMLTKTKYLPGTLLIIIGLIKLV